MGRTHRTTAPWLLALALTAGCGATVTPGGGSGTDGGTGTDVVGRPDGADSPDGGQCVFPSGRVCAVGARCLDDDGCNTCSCTPGGGLACTLLDCLRDAGPPDTAPVDAGPRTCTASTDCAAGQVCQGGTACGSVWTCGPPLGRPCSGVVTALCGCDGVTFSGSPDCPPRPYAFVGNCFAPPPACPLPGGGICPVGSTCPAGDGCNTCMCTSSGTLRCTTLACPRDGGTPTGCRGNTDCPSGQMCSGPPGCAVPWTCVPATPCTADAAPFCACDGVTTFTGSSSCPGQPYSHTGACEGVDAGPPDAGVGDYCLLPSGWHCAAGATCPAGDGCNDCTCAPGGVLRCTARPCAFDGGPMHPTCTSNHECAATEECAGAPGCGTPWSCRPATGRFCSPTLQPYCLCGGQTVYGSATCPPGPYNYVGTCGLL